MKRYPHPTGAPGQERCFVGLLAVSLVAGCASNGDAKIAAAGRDKQSDTTIRLADAARESGDFARCPVGLYRKVLARSPNDVEILLAIGDTQLEGRSAGAAYDTFNKALQLEPKRADAHVALGRIQLMLHRPNQAEVEFTAALALQPDQCESSQRRWHSARSGWTAPRSASRLRQRACPISRRPRIAQQSGPFAGAQRVSTTPPSTNFPRFRLNPEQRPEFCQNLALALGLQGNTAGAARILHADLNEEAVSDNLRYYEAISRTRSATICALSACLSGPAEKKRDKRRSGNPPEQTVGPKSVGAVRRAAALDPALWKCISTDLNPINI